MGVDLLEDNQEIDATQDDRAVYSTPHKQEQLNIMSKITEESAVENKSHYSTTSNCQSHSSKSHHYKSKEITKQIFSSPIFEPISTQILNVKEEDSFHSTPDVNFQSLPNFKSPDSGTRSPINTSELQSSSQISSISNLENGNGTQAIDFRISSIHLLQNNKSKKIESPLNVAEKEIEEEATANGNGNDPPSSQYEVLATPQQPRYHTIQSQSLSQSPRLPKKNLPSTALRSKSSIPVICHEKNIREQIFDSMEELDSAPVIEADEIITSDGEKDDCNDEKRLQKITAHNSREESPQEIISREPVTETQLSSPQALSASTNNQNEALNEKPPSNITTGSLLLYENATQPINNPITDNEPGSYPDNQIPETQIINPVDHNNSINNSSDNKSSLKVPRNSANEDLNSNTQEIFSNHTYKQKEITPKTQSMPIPSQVIYDNELKFPTTQIVNQPPEELDSSQGFPETQVLKQSSNHMEFETQPINSENITECARNIENVLPSTANTGSTHSHNGNKETLQFSQSQVLPRLDEITHQSLDEKIQTEKFDNIVEVTEVSNTIENADQQTVSETGHNINNTVNSNNRIIEQQDDSKMDSIIKNNSSQNIPSNNESIQRINLPPSSPFVSENDNDLTSPVNIEDEYNSETSSKTVTNKTIIDDSRIQKKKPISQQHNTENSEFFVWGHYRNRYYPVKLIGKETEFNPKLKPISKRDKKSNSARQGTYRVVYYDGYEAYQDCDKSFILNLQASDRVKILRNSKVVYEIKEFFNSTSSRGKEIFKSLHCKEIPINTDISGAKSMSLTNQELFLQAPLIRIYDNNNNDYILLKEISSRSSTNNKETVSAISDIFLTQALWNVYVKKKKQSGLYVPFSDFLQNSQKDTEISARQSQLSIPSATQNIQLKSKRAPDNKDLDIYRGFKRLRRSTLNTNKSYLESSDDDSQYYMNLDLKTKNDETEQEEDKLYSSTFENPSNLRLFSPEIETANQQGKIFFNCIFTITSKKGTHHKEESLKNQKLAKLIKANGGIVLEKGLSEMLDMKTLQWANRYEKPLAFSNNENRATIVRRNTCPAGESENKIVNKRGIQKSTTTTVQGLSNEEIVNLHSHDSTQDQYFFNFAAVLSDEACRTSKYLEALALGFPCLSRDYIFDCIEAGELLKNWPDYLLAAGITNILGSVYKSFNITRFFHLWKLGKSLKYQYENRDKPFDNLQIPIYVVEDEKSAKLIMTKECPTVQELKRYLPTIGIDRPHTSTGNLKLNYNSKNTTSTIISLLLLLGYNPQNIYPIKAILESANNETAIIFFPCVLPKNSPGSTISNSHNKSQVVGNYNKFECTDNKEILKSLRSKEPMEGNILYYTREWIIQCIINQRII